MNSGQQVPDLPSDVSIVEDDVNEAYLVYENPDGPGFVLVPQSEADNFRYRIDPNRIQLQFKEEADGPYSWFFWHSRHQEFVGVSETSRVAIIRLYGKLGDASLSMAQQDLVSYCRRARSGQG